MAITIDAHALVWHLDTNLQVKLSSKAFAAIEDAIQNSIVYIPAIAIMEIIHIGEKKRINIDPREMVQKITDSPSYEIVPLDTAIIAAALDFPDFEMHDRIIYATAIVTNTAIVSKDAEIRKNVNVIW